jgi:hypothetical protein
MPEATHNRVTLLGRLTRDPEIRSLEGGDQVATFSVATTDTWKNRAGEPQERSQFHPVVIWNQALNRGDCAPSQKGFARAPRRRARASQLRHRTGDALRHGGRAAALQRLDLDARPRPRAAGRRADGDAPEADILPTALALKTKQSTAGLRDSRLNRPYPSALRDARFASRFHESVKIRLARSSFRIENHPRNPTDSGA